jgi:hypothetical protein
METLLKILILAALPFLAWGYGGSSRELLRHTSWSAGPALRFVSGAGVGAAGLALFHRKLQFFTTLEHELTHLVVGLGFLKAPRSLRISSGGGGRAELTGLNFVILLSPYFLPTLCLLALPLPLILRQEALAAFQVAFGAAWGYHLATTLEEARPRQTDLKEAGQWFAWPFLFVANMVAFGALAAFGTGGYGGMGGFLTRGAAGSWEGFCRVAKHLAR